MNVEALGIVIVAVCISLALMPAGASDFTLEIFGNANMDDTIDELDVEYVQGIIDGTNDETEFADANCDGEIDEEDIAQIEQIIAGEETELTVIDSANRVVTLKMPVNKVVVAYMGPHEPMIILAKDKIAGWEGGIPKYRGDIVEKAGLEEIPIVGEGFDGSGLDYEKILEIDPDIILATSYWAEEVSNKLTKIPVIALDFDEAGAEDMIKEFRKLGIIVGNTEKAEEVIEWIQNYEGIIEERTKDLGEDEMPSYYLEAWSKQYVTLGSNGS